MAVIPQKANPNTDAPDAPTEITPMPKTLIEAPAKVAAKRFCGVKGRSGAPKQNSNAIRHGLKSGKLPKDSKYIEYQMNALRRTLEAAVMAARGSVGIVDAANIQTAVKWERHGALCLRWLRLESNALKPTERLTFSRDIARASAERDKAIAALRLDQETHAPWLMPPMIEDGNGKDGDHDRQ